MSVPAISVFQAACEEIPLHDVLRYLGCREDPAPPQILQLAEHAVHAVQQAAVCRCCWRRVTVTHQSDTELLLDALPVRSRHLSINLDGCDAAFLFGATIGVGPERLIAAGRRLSAADALAADAAGSAAIEHWCDQINQMLAKTARKEGHYLRPRFSAGYGDFSITAQQALVSMLDMPRKIGVTLTSGMMLLPTKSVTAIVGISDTPVNCAHTSCENCQMQSCPYRA